MTWPEAFALTVAVETPVYVWALRPKTGVPLAIAMSLALNVATHPLAFHEKHRLGFAAVEILVWAAESLLLFVLVRLARRKIGFVEAAITSLVANALSAAVGMYF